MLVSDCAVRADDDTHIVEEVVGTGELLQCLESHAQYNSIGHSRSLEHLNPPVPSALGSLLRIQLVLDLEHLVYDYPMVFGNAVQPRHGSLCLVYASVSIVVSGAFGEQKNAESQQQTPEEGDTQWNSPRACIVHALRAEIDAVCNEDTECYKQLV